MVSKPSVKDRKPFFLGFPGERWRAELGGLSVPYHEGNPDVCVIAYENPLKDGSVWYSVTTKEGWDNFDSILMLAAYVRNYFDGIDAKKAMDGVHTEPGTTEGP